MTAAARQWSHHGSEEVPDFRRRDIAERVVLDEGTRPPLQPLKHWIYLQQKSALYKHCHTARDLKVECWQGFDGGQLVHPPT